MTGGGDLTAEDAEIAEVLLMILSDLSVLCG